MATDSTPQSEHRPGDEARAQTIAQRIAREKSALVDQLKKFPIIQVACDKVQISRATFYNWKRDDHEFAKQADEAIADGTLLMNDMAESQLLTGVRDGVLGAIQYWLKHRHPAYSTRVELTAKAVPPEALTPEQEELVRQALHLAGIASSPSTSSPNSDDVSITS